MRRRGLCRVPRGLTLMETLVTLVIMAMVVGVLSEGLFQVNRLEQRLSGGSMQVQLQRLRTLWAVMAIEGLLPGQRGAAERFVGDAGYLSGVSSQVPTVTAAGPQPFRLVLSFSEVLAQTELQFWAGAVAEGDSRVASAPASAVVLTRWGGSGGGFRYLDADGSWRATWPPADPFAPALPLAIGIDRGEFLGWLLVAAPLASAEPLGRRVDIDKLP